MTSKKLFSTVTHHLQKKSILLCYVFMSMEYTIPILELANSSVKDSLHQN